MKTKRTIDIEEALGIIWGQGGKCGVDEAYWKKTLSASVSETVFEDLLTDDMMTIDNGRIVLTPAGDAIGRDITRRHRLAERLFSDVVEINRSELDSTACDVEHIISSGVADAICTLLGHPRACPHGSPIPEGPCCKSAEQQIESIVVPLDRLPVGQAGKVAYIVTADNPSLHKLLSLGVVPGTPIWLHQKAPSYVIKVLETQIALDKEIASRIYVRREG